ncbi:MAG: phosphatidate cytidylyltransferase [Clostridia bacterium]|nr:phosphatidate cytidylyltransferase [Clostridia bacterium]
MKTRIITGIVAIALFVPVCIFSDYVVFPIVMSILSAVGVYEMAKCLGMDKKWALTVPMYIVALALPIVRFYINKQSHFFAIAMIAIFFVLIYSLGYVMFRKNQDKIGDILTLYALFFYIVGCFSSIVCVRYMAYGKYVYLLVFLGAWVCDTFAYFTGRFFGKHKLIPEISPKKTIEGSIGGIVFTIGAFILYRVLLFKIFTDLKINLPYLLVIILAIAASIVSQIGDLVASAIKRQYNLKDYGKLFPGHGGVLDRFDSVMLVAPVVYVIFIISAVLM